MVILLSAFACLPNYGTESGNGWNWAAHLVKAGHIVHVLTRVINQARIDRYLASDPIKNLHFIYVSAPFETGWRHKDRGLYYIVWQVMALRAARAITCIVDFDVIHHVTYGSFHVPTQLWRLGLPTVFGPVGGGQTAPPSMLSCFTHEQRKERLRTFVTGLLPFSPIHRASMKHLARVLVTNYDTLRLATRCGSTNVEFSFDSGLPKSFFVEDSRPGAGFEGMLHLVWVGRILPRKGITLALDALKHVKASVHLTIVGDDDDRSSSFLNKCICERGLRGMVSNLGRLSWEQTRAQYLVSHALLFTSLRESMGSQLLEAMACALPILSLDLHGAQALVTEEIGFRASVSTPQATTLALAEVIDRFAALPAPQKQQMSQNAHRRALTLEWHERVRDIERIYAEVLALSTAAGCVQETHHPSK